MAERVVTVNATTTSGTVNTTLGQVGQYQYIRIRNSGANPVWFNDFAPAATVVAGADECTYLPVGAVTQIPYVASMAVLSVTGPSSLTCRGSNQPYLTTS